MRLAWKAGVPLGLALLMLNSLVVCFTVEDSLAGRWWQLILNVVLAVVVVVILGVSKTETADDNIPVPLEQLDEII